MNELFAEVLEATSQAEAEVAVAEVAVAEVANRARRQRAPRVWSRERLMARILELHVLGVDLSPTSIQIVDSALFSSARSRSHFGSWRRAIEECGLDYECIKRVQRRWSHESILQAICAQHQAGENLLHPDFKTRQRSLYLAACAHRYFGSWRRAVSAAGLDHETMRESRFWTRARIERTIRELNERGDNLSWSSVEKQCPGIYRAARRAENFGSWQGALFAAGVVAKPELRGRRAYKNVQTAATISVVEEIVCGLTKIADASLDTPLSPMPGGESLPREDIFSSSLLRTTQR